MGRLRSLAAVTLQHVRNGRPVAWCPEWMNLGNLLYVAEWAHEGRCSGEERFVLLHPSKEAPLTLFPRLREQFFLAKEEVSFFDRRVMPWSGEEDRRGEHFDPPHLRRYILDHLLPGSPVASPPDDIEDDAIVVNVRRGDYFSVPEHRAAFGMDTETYSLEAVGALITDSGAPSSIVVVSDDVDWCRDNLASLSKHGDVRFRDGSLVDDLSAIVHAQRLVLPNSTFSYWGGYIGDELYRDRRVAAPWFFNREAEGGRAWQLRSHWLSIDSIPGGWEVR